MHTKLSRRTFEREGITIGKAMGGSRVLVGLKIGSEIVRFTREGQWQWEESKLENGNFMHRVHENWE